MIPPEPPEVTLKIKFEYIYNNCIKESIQINKVYYSPLYHCLKNICENSFDHLAIVLENYYIHCFRPANIEFGRIMLFNDLEETCDQIARGIVERGIRDRLHGPFS